MLADPIALLDLTREVVALLPEKGVISVYVHSDEVSIHIRAGAFDSLQAWAGDREVEGCPFSVPTVDAANIARTCYASSAARVVVVGHYGVRPAWARVAA